LARVDSPAAEAYRASFLRRSAALATPDQVPLDEPGICGWVGSADEPRGRLLITDDRAVSTLERLRPELRVQIVNVFAAAPRSRELVAQARSWEGAEGTAMACLDLGRLPPVRLPAGLTLRAVRRVAADPEGGVPLEEMGRACLRAEGDTATPPLAAIVGFLQSLPPTTRLLAALDESGGVRATAGASMLEADATVYAVSTDAAWRHQGVGTAMTAAALTWAHECGARTAALDASPAGRPIYERLAFEPVSAATAFVELA
jgi:GNAT superfamily N-acetyltransferase